MQDVKPDINEIVMPRPDASPEAETKYVPPPVSDDELESLYDQLNPDDD